MVMEKLETKKARLEAELINDIISFEEMNSTPDQKVEVLAVVVTDNSDVISKEIDSSLKPVRWLQVVLKVKQIA